MELDQRNTNENHIQLNNIKLNCSKCCLVINTILEKASGPNFNVFFGTERRFQKHAVFAMKSWLFRDVLGFRLVTSWVSEEAVVTIVPVRRGGAHHSSSFWVVVPDKDDGHGYPICFFHVVLCLPISFCWVVLLFSLLRWSGAAFSQGGAALLLLFVGVVVSSHNINKNIRSMLVRQKTLKRWGEKARKAKGKAPPSKGDLRHYPNEGWRKAAPTWRRRERRHNYLHTITLYTTHDCNRVPCHVVEVKSENIFH